ncbi:MAG: PAP/fibrillin family protein [Trichocoleus desertorum ATA4-8-CV12]|jgi:hypothetical protein|nr:PAP/fibrillin family protein [Trichocoleus desertorum ATA4-8-CV12]
MSAETYEQKTAKQALREALMAYEGNPKHQAVAAAIEHLNRLNPIATLADYEALMDGEWLLISAPNFPDGERQPDGTYVYTLGRLAFNLFQPTSLRVVIDRVLQPVVPIDNGQQRTHDIIVEFTTQAKDIPPLQGIIHNFGICQVIDDKTLSVQFTGGALVPKHLDQMEMWQAVFGNQSKSEKRRFKEKVMSKVANLLLGIIPPQGMDHQTGKVSFTMQRSPKGRLTLLYLDEELRITRGERGTVLVCERLIDGVCQGG